jgi:dynein heavy chain 1, cytosolic
MMETVASPLSPQDTGPNGVSPSSAVFNAIEPSLVVDHLAAVVTIALGATRHDLERDGNLLSSASYADTLQRCSRFASDAQVAMYIQKELIPTTDAPDGPADTGENFSSDQSRARLLVGDTR